MSIEITIEEGSSSALNGEPYLKVNGNTSKKVESTRKPSCSYNFVFPTSKSMLKSGAISTRAVCSTSGNALCRVVANMGGVTLKCSVPSYCLLYTSPSPRDG